MRVLPLLLLMSGCSWLFPPPPVPPETPRRPGPPNTKGISQDAPPPLAEHPVLAPPVLEGAWTLDDGRTVALAAEQASVGEATLAVTAMPGGASLGDLRWVQVTPCAAAVYEAPAWYGAERTDCSPEQAGYDGLLYGTWDVVGGDRYTFLPEGKAWRRGPKRSFKFPVGTWTADATVRGEAKAGEATFGESRYDLYRLDACNTAFVHHPSGNVYRGRRTFPSCAPGEATWQGLTFSLWLDADGNRFDLRPDGKLDYDPAEGPNVPGVWTQDASNLTLSAGEVAVTVATSADPCVLTLADGGALTRAWPICETASAPAP